MSGAAVLKKVMDIYPEVFMNLPRPQLKLVKEAIIYASKVALTEDVLDDEDHKKLVASVTGKNELKPFDRLKAYRLRADLGQVALAKKSGISQSNIAAMEAGKRPIGIISAKKLAKALKCDYRELV